MIELASGRRNSAIKRDPMQIKEFRLYLERCGLTFAQWERQQAPASIADMDAEILRLASRKVELNRHR